MRIDTGKPSGNGWIHRVNSAFVAPPPPKRRADAARAPDFEKLMREYRAAVTADALEEHAKVLGVSAESLSYLGVGWDGEAWTYPMRSASGVVLGIRRRFDDGRKRSVKGGHEGLFIPSGLADGGTLYICEGPTDTAALLSLGFPAVGRPSCTGGTTYVVHLACSRSVVIVSDVDANGAGQRGAMRLAHELRPACQLVQVIVPPPGLKDVRSWLQAGATRRDIESTLNNGPIVRFVEPTRRAIGVSYRER